MILSLNSILRSTLIAGAIIFPVAYEILPSIRPLDIIILLLIPFSVFFLRSVDKYSFALIVVVLGWVVSSGLLGTILLNEPISAERLSFIYKYLIILLIPALLLRASETPDFYNQLLTSVYFASWVLVLWTYLYVLFLGFGLISGNFRPSFPFSNNELASDAHIYSSYLGFFLIAYLFLFCRLYNHSIIIIAGMVGLQIGALFLTGSRTGLVVVGITIMLFCFEAFFTFLKEMFIAKFRMTNLVIGIVGIAAIVGAFIFLLFSVNLNEMGVLDLFSRAINFNFSEDVSSLSRIAKLNIALEETRWAGHILGNGFLMSELVWYDGINSILIAHGGFISIILFYLIAAIIMLKIIAVRKRLRKTQYAIWGRFLFYGSLSVFLSNQITEYIFITRYAFPVLVTLTSTWVLVHRFYLPRVREARIGQ